MINSEEERTSLTLKSTSRRAMFHTAYSQKVGEPSTFHEPIISKEDSLWMTRMQEDIEILFQNMTWDFVPLPQRKKAKEINRSTRPNEMAMTN